MPRSHHRTASPTGEGCNEAWRRLVGRSAESADTPDLRHLSLGEDGAGSPGSGDRYVPVDLWFDAESAGGEPLFEAWLVYHAGKAVQGERHPGAPAT